MRKRPILLPGKIKLAVLLVVLIVSLIPSAEAAVLYQSSAPHISEDGLEVSDFEVRKIGQEPLRVNDTVFMSFTFASVGDSVKFGNQGVYVKVIDPDNKFRVVKHEYEGDTLEWGIRKKFNTSIIVDKEGDWTLTPVYSFEENNVVPVSDIPYSEVRPYANDEIGAYLFVRYRGANYMGINGKSDVLSEIILEMRNDENWTMGEGEWRSRPPFLHVDRINPDKGTVGLSLKNDNEMVDSAIVKPGISGDTFKNRMRIDDLDMLRDVITKNTFVYQDPGSDVPIFSVYVDSINNTTAECMLKYAILINDTFTKPDTNPGNILEAVIGTRHPPEPPTVSGTFSGHIGTPYTYTAQTTDPDGDRVKYIFHWSDGIGDTITEYVDSGLSESDTRRWEVPGTYAVTVTAKDQWDKESESSDELNVTIVSRSPEKPIIYNGTESGVTGKSYTYEVNATDPDGDRIRYTFDWVDGTDNTTTGEVDSGSLESAEHKWTELGTYAVTVTAKDEWGEESEPSDERTVTIENEPPTQRDLGMALAVLQGIVGALLALAGGSLTIFKAIKSDTPIKLALRLGIPEPSIDYVGRFGGLAGVLLLLAGLYTLLK